MSMPKVLILNQPFNSITGGGITLSNLFAGWDKEKIAVACTGQLLSGQISTEICDTYYQLGHLEQKWIFPFSLIKRRYDSGLLPVGERKVQIVGPKKSKWRERLIMDYFFPVLHFLGLFHFASRVSLSPSFCRWLDDYQPEVIYAQANSRTAINFCIAVQQYLGKPMVFHVMDDWISLEGKRGLFGSYWKRRIDREFRQLVHGADLCLSISQYMSEEYQSRYGKHFIPFHNPIDLVFWKQYQRKDYELSASPKLLYAGRTGLGIDASLQALAAAIQRVNHKLDTSLKLVLQTPATPAWMKKYDSVEHRSFVAYEDLPRVFAETDLLVLPYDFSETALSFIRFSMPTKASEYMISGTPILLFAPEDTAVVRYAREYQWAKVVTDNQLAVLMQAIEDLLLDKSERRRIAEHAKEFAARKHDADEVRKAFHQLIGKCANQELTVTV